MSHCPDGVAGFEKRPVRILVNWQGNAIRRLCELVKIIGDPAFTEFT